MELLVKVSADYAYVLRLGYSFCVQKGSKGENIVSPEHALDAGQLRFTQIRARGCGLQLLITNADVKSSVCRIDDDVGPVAAQLAVDLVAYVDGDGDHCGGDCNAERHRDCCQQLAPLLPPKRLIEKTQEHDAYLPNFAVPAEISAWLITISVPLLEDFSGIGLHPPDWPID